MVDTSVEGFKRYIAGVLTEGTADKYARNLRIFLSIMKDFGDTSLEKLPPNLIQQYVVLLRERGYSASTIHNHVHALIRYFQWIRSQGADIREFSYADLPRISFRVRETLDPDQLERYFELADEFDEPVRTATMVAPCIGLRAHELAKLRLEHLRKGKFTIGEVTHEALLLRVIGKGNKERIVPFLEEGTQILTQYLTGWRSTTKGPWLFPMGHSPKLCDKPLPARTLAKALIKIREPMGLSFTPHTMRRTYLTVLWRRGVSEAVLANIAGHKDISTLIKHYLHLNENDIVNRVHTATGGARLFAEGERIDG